jgi:hypothetical protein
MKLFSCNKSDLMLQLAVKGAPHSFSRKIQKQHITVIAAYFCIPFVSLCVHRTRESRPSKPRPAATPARVGGRSSFLGLRCSLVRTTTYWWCELPFDYFLVVCAHVPLLLEGCSWDDTTLILPTSN